MHKVHFAGWIFMPGIALWKRCVIFAASDQLPKERYVKHFHRFMGIKTKVLTGTESLINRYDMKVYYCHVKRVKRGYYVCQAELLDESH